MQIESENRSFQHNTDGAEDRLTTSLARYRVRFRGHPRPFLVALSSCNNPDCPCRELTLQLHEQDATETKQERLVFKIIVDVDTGRGRCVHPQLLPIVRRLGEEFFRDLSEHLLTDLRATFDDLKEHNRKLGLHEIPVEDVRNGALVPYSEVIGSSESVLRGGAICSFQLEDGAGTYYIEDQYCPNPDCDCNEVHLTFLHFDGTRLSHGFTATCRFDGRIRSFEAGTIRRARARRILDHWIRNEEREELFGELAGRYEEIKMIGARILGRD